MIDVVGRPILAVGMAPRATKGNENLQVLRFSPNLGKAGRGAMRGPGDPPYFGLVFDRGAGSELALSEGVSDAD